MQDAYRPPSVSSVFQEKSAELLDVELSFRVKGYSPLAQKFPFDP